MRQAAVQSDSAVDTSARFLGELDNLWSLLRLYGTTHPAFRRGADAAAAAAKLPLRVSLSPKGFTVDKTTLSDPLLAARPTCAPNCPATCPHACPLQVTRRGNPNCFWDGHCTNGVCIYSCCPENICPQ